MPCSKNKFHHVQYGLIEYIRHQETYKTTAKGLDFSSINKMKALILYPPDMSSRVVYFNNKRKLSKPQATMKNVWWYFIVIVFVLCIL